MNWFGEDFDKTLLTLGAVVITTILIYKIIGIYSPDSANNIVSSELLMGLIQIPNTMISVAVGKKWGEATRNGGNKP